MQRTTPHHTVDTHPESHPLQNTRHSADKSPMRRQISGEDVAGMATFLVRHSSTSQHAAASTTNSPT